jgi:hypothetical protein
MAFLLFNSISTGGPRYARRELAFEGGFEVDPGFDSGSTPVAIVPATSVVAGDVSGGTTSAPVAQATEQIEEFAAEGGGVLAIVYGEHLIAGNLIVHKFVEGTPNTSIVYVGLGDGQGNGGGHGEWEGPVAVYYAGELLSVSPDASTAGYRFYRGHISTGIADPNQPVDAFLSGGLAYSGTPIIAVKIPDDFANAEDRPDKLRGRYKGRRVYDFDVVGRNIGYGYSVNPARVAADRVLSYYEHKFPNDAALAMRKLQEKINWESWCAWKENCDETISWDNGTSVVNIPRFEAHIAFTQDAILADALDQICAASGTQWQDDGEQLIFLPPTFRITVHHFDESNIVRAPQIEPRDLRERPNFFVAEYRDIDDEFLGLASTPPIRREKLIAQVGEIKSVRALPNMRQSQAQRLLERQARLEADNPNICTLAGDETSIHILPGDLVTVSHPIPGWTYQICLVLSVSVSIAEDAPDTCDFVLQQIDDSLYIDTAHSPRQEALTP